MIKISRSSIFVSITFTFLLSLISIFLAAVFLLEYDKQEYADKLNTKYSIIARATLFHLNNFIDDAELQQQIKDYSMRRIDNNKIKDSQIRCNQNYI